VRAFCVGKTVVILGVLHLFIVGGVNGLIYKITLGALFNVAGLPSIFVACYDKHDNKILIV
jgi:hypothetical protein